MPELFGGRDSQIRRDTTGPGRPVYFRRADGKPGSFAARTKSRIQKAGSPYSPKEAWPRADPEIGIPIINPAIRHHLLKSEKPSGEPVGAIKTKTQGKAVGSPRVILCRPTKDVNFRIPGFHTSGKRMGRESICGSLTKIKAKVKYKPNIYPSPGDQPVIGTRKISNVFRPENRNKKAENGHQTGETEKALNSMAPPGISTKPTQDWRNRVRCSS